LGINITFQAIHFPLFLKTNEKTVNEKRLGSATQLEKLNFGSKDHMYRSFRPFAGDFVLIETFNMLRLLQQQ
jgi:hypothetical protein